MRLLNLEASFLIGRVRTASEQQQLEELFVVSLSLKAATPYLQNKVESDNNSTNAYTNHMAGRTVILSAITRDIWHTAFRFSIHLIAVQCTGKLNKRPRRLSR